MKKTIFITGSTDGIGKVAAIALAKAGHAIYIHGRNAEKVARVVAETGAVGGFTADLSDLNAVVSLAKEIQEKQLQIDVLINNAGVYHSTKATNEAGLDLRFVVNYLAPVLLTEKLLPLLTDQARILNLSSAAQASVSIPALRGEENIGEQKAYAQSKLGLTMWSYDLAKAEPGRIVIPVNPGSLLNTRMVQEAFGTHWAPADKGAKILCDLAVTDRYPGITGKYFDNDHGAFGRAHADAYDPQKIATLLEATAELLAPYQ